MYILILSGDDMSFYKFRKELISALVQESHNVILATHFDGYKDRLSDLGCTTIEVSSLERRGTGVFSDIKLCRQYRSIIKQVKPDVILTYTLKPRIYGNLTSGKTLIINTITGMGSYTLDNPTVAAIAVFLDRLALRKSSYIFFQNSGSKQEYYERKIIKDPPCGVVPASGVNLNDFFYIPYSSHDDFNITFIGRLMRDKGIEELFYTAKRFHSEKWEDVHFKLYGFFEEDYRDEINNLKREGIIEYGGFVSDVTPCLRAADCVVLPSYHEGVGNAIQEASASGRPVIASNIPGCRETVEDGVTGFLCEPRNAESLYNAVAKMVELPRETREQMGIKAREKMKKEANRDSVINKYLSVIHEICDTLWRLMNGAFYVNYSRFSTFINSRLVSKAYK